MELSSYIGILRRRWVLIVAIVLLDLIASGYLYRKAHAATGYQACSTLYVADLSSPSLISAPETSLQSAGELLAGETAANFFGDDVVDVAESADVSTFIDQRLRVSSMQSWGVSGSRRDRTVTLCLNAPNSATAGRAGDALALAMTKYRKDFLGAMAKRVYTRVISPTSVAAAPTSHAALSFLLRLILGVLVALALALLWDAVDPHVRNSDDLRRTLGVPVLSD